jgi:F0F1-type ATP synthase membrane subunit b/b'
METVLAIFAELGLNTTVFYQFVLVVAMFILTKSIFFGHLQNVLDTRENKSTKSEGTSDKVLEDIKKMDDEFNVKVKEASKKFMDKASIEKQQILSSLNKEYKNEEESINQFVSNSKKMTLEEINKSKIEILGSADELANSLVNKITKG